MALPVWQDWWLYMIIFVRIGIGFLLVDFHVFTHVLAMNIHFKI